MFYFLIIFIFGFAKLNFADENFDAINFSPSELINLNWFKSIQINATFNESLPFDVSGLFISIKSEDPSIAVAEPDRIFYDGNSFNFTIVSKFIGRTKLKFYAIGNEKNESLGSFEVPVLPPNSFLQPIFTLVMSVIVVINTFVLGLQLEWQVIVAQLKRPVNVGIGVCAQFLIMPPIALGVGFALLAGNPTFQLALFAVACAGGSGHGSNFWTYLLDGDISLGVTIAFVSHLASAAMLPMWLYTVGNHVIARGTHINIPFEHILLALALLIIPNAVGIMVKHFKPDFAAKSKRYIKYLAVCVIFVVITLGTASTWFVFLLLTWRTLLCGALLSWSGYLVGYGIAWICCREQRHRITIMVETGIQSGGLAILLMRFSLPSPESDLAMVIPFSVMMCQKWPLIAIGMPQLIARCKSWRNKRKQKRVAPESNSEKIKMENSKKIVVVLDEKMKKEISPKVKIESESKN